jgi:hypothetical protein
MTLFGPRPAVGDRRHQEESSGAYEHLNPNRIFAQFDGGVRAKRQNNAEAKY